MSEYNELIKRLRELHPEEFGDAWDFAFACQQVVHEAADAIEELSQKAQQLPGWISVTERLPENTGKYLVCGQWRGKPAEIWVCDLIAFGKIKGWSNNVRNPVVTHWMPLPESPKEES